MDPQTGAVLLRRSCGTLLPPVVYYSLSQRVLVTFQTDDLNVYRGWSLEWQEVCGLNTVESPDVLQSQEYDDTQPSPSPSHAVITQENFNSPLKTLVLL